MPIIQISEIRHRRGLKQDLPELAEGELGLAVDTGELFIGTASLPGIVRDLIAVVWQQSKQYRVGDYVAYNGMLYRCITNHISSLTFNGSNWEEINQNDFANPNTKVLTEWSKNIENILKYSYLNRNSQLNTERPENFSYHEIEDFYDDLPDIWPYQAVKRVGASSYDEIGVRRYLQERLDEQVSVLSFGASGTGRRHISANNARARNDMDAEANAIRRATLSLANTFADDGLDGNLREENKAVYFPAGTYVVNKPLLLTNRTRWIGDGVGKTRIIFNINGLTLNELNNALLMTVDKSLSVDDAIDETKVSEASYENISEMIEDIIISGISFEISGSPAGGSTVTQADAVRLIRVNNVTFQDCAFIGSWNNVAAYPSNGHLLPYSYAAQSQAVGIDSTSDSVLNSPMYSRNIKFTNCHFERFHYITNITDYVYGVTFDKCTAAWFYKGISLGVGASVNPSAWATVPNVDADYNGPRSINIFNCVFNDISGPGLVVYRGYNGDTSYAEYAITSRITDPEQSFRQAGNVTLMGNHWESIGEYFGEPKSAVILLYPGTTYNSIIGDTFSRDFNGPISDADAQTFSRIYRSDEDPNIIIVPQEHVKLPSEKGNRTSEILVSPTPIALDPVAIIGKITDTNLYNRWQISYTIVYDDVGLLRRKKYGTIDIVADSINRTISYNQDFNITSGPDDIQLVVEVEDNSIISPPTAATEWWVELKAIFTDTIPNVEAKIHYSVERFQSPDPQ